MKLLSTLAFATALLLGQASAAPTTVTLDEAAAAAACSNTSCPRGYTCAVVGVTPQCTPADMPLSNCPPTGRPAPPTAPLCPDNVFKKAPICACKYSKGKKGPNAGSCKYKTTTCPPKCDAKACKAPPAMFPCADGKLPNMKCRFNALTGKCGWEVLSKCAGHVTEVRAEEGNFEDRAVVKSCKPNPCAPGYKCQVGLGKAQCIPQSFSGCNCPTKSKPKVKSPNCKTNALYQSAAVCTRTWDASLKASTCKWEVAKCPPAKCDTKACGAAPEVFPCNNGTMPTQTCSWNYPAGKCTWNTDYSVCP